MPKHMLPTNDLGRLKTMTTLLSRCRESSLETQAVDASNGAVLRGYAAQEADDWYLSDLVSPVLVQRLKTMVPLYQGAYTEARLAGATARGAKGEAARAIALLKMTIRDAWAVLRRRNRRLGYPDTVLAFYCMPKHRELQVKGSQGQWIFVGQRMLKGDQEAQEDGYPPMQAPDASELQACVEAAENNEVVAQRLSLRHKELRLKLTKIRKEIITLYSDLTLAVRYALNKLPYPMQREVMRNLGFNFALAPRKEKVEPEPLAVVATPALPAPPKVVADPPSGQKETEASVEVSTEDTEGSPAPSAQATAEMPVDDIEPPPDTAAEDRTNPG